MPFLNPDYTHPHQDNIIDGIQKILSNSDRAMELLQKCHETPYEISIIKSFYTQPYVLSERKICLFVPPMQENVTLENALDYYGCLVELANLRDGKARPKDNLHSVETQQNQHLFNLDIILEMFEIIEELEDSGYKAKQEIRAHGFKKLYSAWKKEEDYQELINIYWSIL